MGEITKTDFKVFNGTDYDTKYFSTSADQVSFNNGESQTDLQVTVTQMQTQGVNIMRQLGALPKIAIVDLNIPVDQMGQAAGFIPPSGFDMRKCAIIPAGYYTGERDSLRLTVHGLLDSSIFSLPGNLSYSAEYDGGSNSVSVRFSPPADLGSSVRLRLILIQAVEIEDESVAVG